MKNALKITLIIIIGIIAPLFFVGTPLLLGILSRKPLLGAFGVIWGEIGIYGFFVAGILAGAFFVLYRPPSIGESHIEIKNKNRVLYKSPIVFFDPPKDAPNPVIIDISKFPYPFLDFLITRKPPYGLPIIKREEWVRGAGQT